MNKEIFCLYVSRRWIKSERETVIIRTFKKHSVAFKEMRKHYNDCLIREQHRMREESVYSNLEEYRATIKSSRVTYRFYIVRTKLE